MNEPLVSIIIPVYNVESYLRRCLDSINSINYPSKEVIIVDDGAQDGSGVIIDEYVKANDRWVAIHKPHNEGVAKARISGTERASGDFLMFVDPDDYVDPEIVSRLVSAIIGHNADVSCCGFRYDTGTKLYEDERNIDMFYDRTSLDHFISSSLLFDNSLQKSGLPMYMWAKLYRNHTVCIMEALRVGAGLTFGEDLVFTMSLLNNPMIKSIVSINEPLYYYVIHPDQITRKHPVDLLNERVKVWDILDKSNDGHLTYQLSSRIWMFVKTTLYSCYSPSSFRKYIILAKRIRKIAVINKYIFESSDLSSNIKKHPHYFFIKYHLYFSDYLFSAFVHSKSRKVSIM